MYPVSIDKVLMYYLYYSTKIIYLQCILSLFGCFEIRFHKSIKIAVKD